MRVITRLNVGGPAIQAMLLTARLDAKRFETLLVSGTEGPAEGNVRELGRFEPVRSVTVPELGRRVAPLDDLRALARITAIARVFQPQIVHTHLAKAGFVGRLAGRLAGAQVIVHTYHGSVFRGYFGRRESALYMGIERALGRISTRLVAITPRQRAELVQLRIGRPDKIVEIDLGFDLRPFCEGPDRDTARDRLQLPRDGPIVGLVARLVPIKDVATFLLAVADLSKSLPKVQAVVVGDGTERVNLERLAGQLGLGARCRFLGWRSDMADVYASLDVLALSSLNEGAPVATIEAMAASRAVVATAVGGVPDVVEHGRTGLLVPPANPGALAEAMRTVLVNDALRREYGRAGHERVLAHFDASRLVADIEGLYHDLLAECAPLAAGSDN